MSDQVVRLVFLGSHGEALRSVDAVIGGTKRLTAAEREQAAASRQVSTESARSSRGFQALERDIGKTSRGALAGSGIFRGLGRSIAFASASFLGGYGLLAVVTSSVNVLKEAGANAAETGARLRATGNAAGVTAKQIDVLATATFRKTGYDVEAVHAAENLLLTFTEVRNEVGRGNDVYTRAAKLIPDLARAMKSDLSSEAVKLGRALNDPIRGLITLSREGVQFTQGQRDQVKALTESGRILEAQKIILDAVAVKVGGVAQAYGGTAAGKVDKFRGEIRLLEKDLATALLPDLVKLVDAATKWANKLEENKPAQQQFRRDVEGVAHAVGDVARVLHEATQMVGGTKNALELLIGLKALSWFSKLIGTVGTATTAGEGILGAGFAVGGLLANLKLLAARAATPIVITVIVNKIIKDLTGTDILKTTVNDANAGGPGDLIPVKRNGKWVDPITGKPVKDQAYWNRQAKKGGSAAPEMYPLARRGSLIGSPGAGTHSYTEGAGPGGFQWQDDQAVDISMKPGEAVLAAEDGVIGNDLFYGGDSGRFSGWGFQLLADSGNVYFYKHLKSMSVAAGDRVSQGDVLGHGTTTGHLHFAKKGAGSAADVLGRNRTTGPTSKTPRTRDTRHRGPSQLQQLDLALAQAGTTKTMTDDRAALVALIAYYKKQLTNPNLPVTTRIGLLNTESGYISQLDALAPKGPSKASAAALVNIHHTLDAVTKLVDQAGLDKRFGAALAKINSELGAKTVTSETLARIRNQLGDITKAAKTELAKAAAAVKAGKKAFTDAWAQLAQDAFDTFDKETTAHVGPTRSLLNQMIGEHDKGQIDQAVLDAKQALDDALAGVNASQDSDILSKVRDMVGKAALANAIDKAQSQILGISPQEVGSGALIDQLQQLLAPGGKVVDPAAVKAAQAAYDEAVYQQKIFDLGKQADAEDSAYTDARAALREALDKNLAAWGSYYTDIGTKTDKAAGDFATVWAGVLKNFPTSAGGTSSAPGLRTIGSGFTIPSGVIGAGFGGAFASGGEGVVAKPTLFIAGEGGQEHYKFTPMRGGASSSSDGSVAHVHLTLGDGLEQLVDARIVKATPGISVTIGKDASLRARSGRY